LEVELAVGKSDYTFDLQKALENALSKDYALCEAGRRLTKSSPEVGMKRRRILVDGDGDNEILLSPLVFKDTGEECTQQSVLASSCVVTTVEFEAYGTDNEDMIMSSLKSITVESSTFDTELMMNGIVDVRFHEANRSNSIDYSNSSVHLRSTSNLTSGQTTMAVVLSLAAVILVAAIILRRSAARRKHMGYGPTYEEQYGNECLGITSLDRMEHSSDSSDTYYSPRIPFPGTSAASI
jgi:hypothetical protein